VQQQQQQQQKSKKMQLQKLLECGHVQLELTEEQVPPAAPW
jgi:hypothetical protein